MTIDPRTGYPGPPFAPQQQSSPGSSARMKPEPSCDEDTYKGAGKLDCRMALVTGANSGIGRAVALAFAKEGAANVRVHATTHRVVSEHFAEEQPWLTTLPAGPFQAVLRLERRITKDGMVSIDGNLYSVPDTTRRRPVEVHSAANEVSILEAGRIVAVHPVMDGRGQRRIIAGHRTTPAPTNNQTPRNGRLSSVT